jgi:hypothetical protein
MHMSLYPICKEWSGFLSKLLYCSHLHIVAEHKFVSFIWVHLFLENICIKETLFQKINYTLWMQKSIWWLCNFM